MESRLTPFQLDVLERFGPRQPEFFLTGGAALAGFHLGHRTTEDLDLFVTEGDLDAAVDDLGAVVRELGASIESLRTGPTFRRFLVRRGEESVVVDLAVDSAPQAYEEKLRMGTVRVDPPEEIAANKLCALLSRAEIRDLVDLRALEAAGSSVEAALPHAMRKDGGLTPGQLAFVLSEIRIGGDARIPGGVSTQELESYVVDLRRRLARLAHPDDA